jgi:hypothetical protein
MSDLIMGPIITTKYFGQTDSHESRIMAIHRRDSETIWRCYLNYDHSLSPEANHLAAAEKLLAKWPYENRLKIAGSGHDDKAYYFLCASC